MALPRTAPDAATLRYLNQRSFDFTNESNLRRIMEARPAAALCIFPTEKAREVDSGIVELEIPSDIFHGLDSIRPGFVDPDDDDDAAAALSGEQAWSSSTAASDSSSSSNRFAQTTETLSTDSSFGLTATHAALELQRRDAFFQYGQRLYPADAVLFVGNLPARMTDLQLSDELLRSFSCFGPTFVHVGRQYTREFVKPYALVQFSAIPLAWSAYFESRHLRIGGRLCRVERSSAPRGLLVSVPLEFGCSTEELFGLLHSFGEVEKIESKFPVGAVVIYRNYGSFLDAKRFFEKLDGVFHAVTRR